METARNSDAFKTAKTTGEQIDMETLGGALFEDFQSTIDGTIETCSVCHGPGHLADVEVVHGLE